MKLSDYRQLFILKTELENSTTTLLKQSGAVFDSVKIIEVYDTFFVAHIKTGDRDDFQSISIWSVLEDKKKT